jgi:hypothetical protein
VITLGGPDPGATISGQPVFTQINNTVGTIEFYSGDISANFGTAASVFSVAGAQDNGSSTARWTNPPGPGAATTAWIQRIGGDGMYARLEPKQTNDAQRRVYMESQNGNLRVSTTGEDGVYSGTTVVTWPWNGDVKSFVFPYEIDKHQCKTFAGVVETLCNHLIAGSNKVYESIVGGVNPADWHSNSPVLTKGTLADRSFINQLAYAHSDNKVAIAGTNDGNVWYGFGMGQPGTNSASWVNVTDGNAVLPNRPILDVTINPVDPLVGYAAVGGFDENTPQDGHVFQVTCAANCGSFTWLDKTGNLPNIPVDSIIGNPLSPNQVFAGTDWGLYYTNNINAAVPIWSRFGGGLPNVMIWDMAIDRGDTTLALFTRGRGVWAFLLSPNVPTAATVTSFSGKSIGRKSVRLSWRTVSETSALGYNVWRFAGGKGVKVNRGLIAAKGTGARGAAYSLVDRNARPGAVYTYRLQVVRKDGKRSFHAGTILRVVR